MAITKILLEQQLGDIQSQIDMMRREFDLFRGYTNKQFSRIYKELDYIKTNMATKSDFANIKADLADTRSDIANINSLLLKIAQKVGPSP